MNHLPERVQRGLGDGLGQRGMRMDGQVDFLDRELVLSGDAELVDQLRRVRTDDVRAEDLAVLRVADDLDEPLGLSGRPRASIVREGEASDLVVELLLLALLLGEPDRRHFGMTVGRVRDVAVVHEVDVLLAGEHFRDDDPLA